MALWEPGGSPLVVNRLLEAEMLDCLVIGAGPAGLTAAMYLARFRRSICVIDAGHSRAKLIPTSHNYPGFKGVGGAELLKRLREQALQYEVQLEAGQVEAIRINQPRAFSARVGADEVEARTVILATGIVDKKPSMTVRSGDPRDVVRYCPVCDGFEAMDRKIVVLGGEEAATKAQFLRTFSREVWWFTDSKVDGPPRAAQSLAIPCQGLATHIETTARGVSVTTADGAVYHADLLYPALGCEGRSALATKLGARCTPVGTLIVDEHQQTSVDGLYAIGDVVSDLHQITVATGHAAVAATAIHNRLPRNPR